MRQSESVVVAAALFCFFESTQQIDIISFEFLFLCFCTVTKFCFSSIHDDQLAYYLGYRYRLAATICWR